MWQMAIPVGLKIGSALANHFSNKSYEKKAKKAASRDALVAALSQGAVQSNSAPDYKPSKLGAALGIGGDLAGMAQMLGAFQGQQTPGMVYGGKKVPKNLYDGNYNQDTQNQLAQFFGSLS